MQLQATVNSQAVNTHQSLSSASAGQPAVTGTVIPSVPLPESLHSTPPRVVPASSAGADLNSHSDDRQRFNKDPLAERSNDKSHPEVLGNDEEQRLIRELAALDREVRQHEVNNSAVGDAQTSVPDFEYERGPDGRSYLIGGEVSIDTSAVPDDPAAALEKSELILKATLSLAEPSLHDSAAADRAVALGDEARAELNGTEAEETDSARNDAAELREALRSEKQQQQIEERVERKEVLSEKLQDFNQQLEEVSQKFAEINQLMIDAGVFKKLFPEGTFLDRIV